MIGLLYYEKAKRIDFGVLEKLCVYFGCTVDEMLEFKRNNKLSAEVHVSQNSLY